MATSPQTENATRQATDTKTAAMPQQQIVALLDLSIGMAPQWQQGSGRSAQTAMTKVLHQFQRKIGQPIACWGIAGGEQPQYLGTSDQIEDAAWNADYSDNPRLMPLLQHGKSNPAETCYVILSGHVPSDFYRFSEQVTQHGGRVVACLLGDGPGYPESPDVQVLQFSDLAHPDKIAQRLYTAATQDNLK